MKKKIIIGLLVVLALLVDVIAENPAPYVVAVIMSAAVSGVLSAIAMGVYMSNPKTK